VHGGWVDEGFSIAVTKSAVIENEIRRIPEVYGEDK
jgi:hypothetical protein